MRNQWRGKTWRELPEVAISEDSAQGLDAALAARGRTLSLTVVAEGVETQEQEAFLRAHSCDEMQGCYFNKPVAGEQFSALVRQHIERARA